jgi:hypothetical protein
VKTSQSPVVAVCNSRGVDLQLLAMQGLVERVSEQHCRVATNIIFPWLLLQLLPGQQHVFGQQWWVAWRPVLTSAVQQGHLVHAKWHPVAAICCFHGACLLFLYGEFGMIADCKQPPTCGLLTPAPSPPPTHTHTHARTQIHLIFHRPVRPWVLVRMHFWPVPLTPRS